MVNEVLFNSVIYFILPVSILEFFFFFNYHSLLNILVTITSLLNHGYSNKKYIILDRCMVYFISIVNIYICPEINLYLSFFSLLLYTLSKISINYKYKNFFHCILHIIGSCSNIVIMIKINKRQFNYVKV